MRFHSKFGLYGWVLISNALILNYGWLRERHATNSTKCFAMLAAALAISFILDTFFVYWEFHGEFLRQRRFWMEKLIRSDEIRKVSGRGYWEAKDPDRLTINYANEETSPKGRRIYVDPRKVPQFITALRQFAPEAAFDI